MRESLAVKARPGRNQHGQKMGTKGELTRARLLAATLTLIKTTAMKDLRIADISRAANTSAATFYLYFHDVSEAVLALAAAQSQSTPQLLAMLDHPWDPATAFEQSAAFTQLYVKTWKANRDLFRVRNLAADEGDRRFIDARYRAIAPLLDALSKIVATAQAQGRVRNDLAPFSTAAALIAMLDRISAVPSYRDDQHDGADPQLIRSASYFAVCALSGADPAVSG